MANAYTLFYEIRTNNTQFDNAIKQTTKTVSDSGKVIDNYKRSAQTVSSSFSSSTQTIIRFKSEVSSLSEQMQKSVSQMGNLANANKNFTSSFSKLASAVGVGNLVAGAITKLTSSLTEGASAILDYSARMEQTKIGFTTLLGNAQLATKHLNDLKQFALSTPFEFEGLAKASQRLQGVGVSTAKVMPLMKDLGNIVAATGDISEERFGGITTAISQMISKTKVSAEEMEQLAERGVPAWKLLADATGKTQAELRKMSEAGALSSDVMVAALQKISRERFGDAMEKQSRTFGGAMSNIKDVLMQTAATAFEPLFQQISNLAVRFSNEIQAQGNDFRAVGEVTAKYIGEGLGIGLEAAIGALGQFIGTRLKEIWTEGKIVSPLLLNVLDGLGKGLGITGGTAATAIKGINTNLSDVLKSAKNMPSLADMLKAGEAAKQTDTLNKVISDLTNQMVNFGNETQVAKTKQELLSKGVTDFSSALARNALLLAAQIDKMQAVKKQNDAYRSTFDDLINKIRFFGDESEVARVKQNLLSQGVTDFSGAVAQTTLKLAEYLDKLTANKKATDEYNNKVKSLKDELLQMRENANFESRFPNPSAMDKFTEWVRKNAQGMKGLKDEIAATAREIEKAAKAQAVWSQQGNYTAFSNFISNLTKGIEFSTQKMSSLKESLLDVAKSMNLVKQFTQQIGAGNNFRLDVTDITFADKAQSFISEINRIKEGMKLATDDIDQTIQNQGWTQSLGDALTKIQLIANDSLGKVTDKFRDFLSTLQTVDKEGKKISLFADKGNIDGFIEQILFLSNVIQKSQISEGMKKLAESAESLGLRFKGMNLTEVEKVQELFSNPSMTDAIKAQAEAWGMTAEKLREVMTLQAQFKDNPSTSTRPRIVPTGEDSLWSQITSRINDNLKSVGEVGRTSAQMIADSFTGAFMQVNQIFQSAVTSANGFFSGVLDGFKNFAKQLIAEMTAVLLVATVLGAITAAFGGGFGQGFGMGIKGGAGTMGGDLLGGIGGIFKKTASIGTHAAASSISSIAAITDLGLPGHYNGGFTGFGNPNDIAGIVHKQEYVVKASDVRAMGGASGVENRLSGNSGKSIVVNNTFNISTPDANSFRQSQAQIERQITATVKKHLMSEA